MPTFYILTNDFSTQADPKPKHRVKGKIYDDFTKLQTKLMNSRLFPDRGSLVYSVECESINDLEAIMNEEAADLWRQKFTNVRYAIASFYFDSTSFKDPAVTKIDTIFASSLTEEEKADLLHQQRQSLSMHFLQNDQRLINLIKQNSIAAVQLLSCRYAGLLSLEILAEIAVQWQDDPRYQQAILNKKLDRRATLAEIFSDENLGQNLKVKMLFSRNSRLQLLKQQEQLGAHKTASEEGCSYGAQQNSNAKFFQPPKPSNNRNRCFARFSDGKEIDFDPYAALGLNDLNREDVTQDVIKKAYRKLALSLHPDMQVSVHGERFKQINQARDVLSDSILRHEYDQQNPVFRPSCSD